MQKENKSSKKCFRVLFIYYNPRKMSLVPPSIALFSSLLKSIDVEVDLFDTTLYEKQDNLNSDVVKEKNLIVKLFRESLDSIKKVNYKSADMVSDLENLIKTFKPDLLAVTTVESTFKGSISLLRGIRRHKIPTVMGGVFATFAPEIVISYPEIDMLCIGDGEKALVELVTRMREGKDHSRVPNLWIKQKDGDIIKNPVGRLVSLDENPIPDMSIFEEARFYRAMGGKIYKMFAVETHRGCIFNCGFCNSPLQNRFYRENTNQSYFRHKSIKKVKEEVAYYKTLGAEYVFLWADNFFAYPDRQIDEFCEMYTDYKLPFYCQSHPENLTREKILKLKKVGMQRVGIGIEHGNEGFRKRVVNRSYSNKMLIARLAILTELGIEYSVNNIVGFPDETPDLAMDTVELNRQHSAANIGCSIFTPFHGTPLRKLAIEKGYLKDKDLIAPSNAEASVLNMPGFSPEEILGKRRTFNLYVKFPKNRWGEIKRAEELTSEGDRIWEKLREEYISTYVSSSVLETF